MNIMDIFGYWLHQAMGMHLQEEEERKEQEKKKKKEQQERERRGW